MTLLKERDRAALCEEFAKLTGKVRIIFFTQALGCETCEIAQQILEEVAGLSDRIELQKFNYAIDRDPVAQYGITRIPAFALVRLEEAQDGDGQPVTRERDYG